MKDRQCDSADGNSFNNTLGVWAVEVLPTNSSAKCLLPVRVADLELKKSSGDFKRRQADSWWQYLGILFVSVFSLCLGKYGRKSSPVPAAAGARQAFYEWGPGGGGEGLCYTSSWVMRFIHSQPSSPGCILKDIAHFWQFQLDRFPPSAAVGKLEHQARVCVFLLSVCYLVGEMVGEVSWEKDKKALSSLGTLVLHPPATREVACGDPLAIAQSSERRRQTERWLRAGVCSGLRVSASLSPVLPARSSLFVALQAPLWRPPKPELEAGRRHTHYPPPRCSFLMG